MVFHRLIKVHTRVGYMVAVDLAMLSSGKNKNDAGKDLRDLKEETFSAAKFTVRSLPGKGNSNIKLVSFQDAIELIMVLPGKVAKETRIKFANIIKRYLAGDSSLITEIQANAESNAPIAQLARASLPEKDQEDPEVRRKRVKREDLELIKLEQEIEEMRASTQQKRIKNFNDSLALMAQIRPDWKESDVRFRLQTEDMIKNIIAQPAVLAITNGSATTNAAAITNGPSTDPSISGSGGSGSISISQIAQEFGKRLTHGQSIQAGGLVAKRYKERYNTNPPKHNQWVDGAERMVNSYTERDRGMVVEVKREHQQKVIEYFYTVL